MSLVVYIVVLVMHGHTNIKKMELPSTCKNKKKDVKSDIAAST